MPTLLQRLEKFTQLVPFTTCWLWDGATRNGYGCLSHKGKTLYAHRLVFEFNYGPIPDKLLVRHTCDNPPCVNPAHLIIGTFKDNTADMYDRHRENPPKGDRNFNSKLNIEKAHEIRRLYSTGNYSRRKLAKKFQVSKGPIDAILSGKTWNP